MRQEGSTAVKFIVTLPRNSKFIRDLWENKKRRICRKGRAYLVRAIHKILSGKFWHEES
jgi:hypothetical protein